MHQTGIESPRDLFFKYSFMEISGGAPASKLRILPQGLNGDEREVYNIIATVCRKRQAAGTQPPNIVVVTDLAKDYDDLAAMIVLKELHRLGLVNLLGFVANLAPAKERAVYGRGALDSLGLQHIPIAIGTDGIGQLDGPGAHAAHIQHPYEFTGQFYLDLKDSPPPMPQGVDLLADICSKVRVSGDKIKFLLISSLKDVASFTDTHSDLFEDVVSDVVFQGGYKHCSDGVEPDFNAANNKFDRPSATKFHKFISDNQIKSAVYTKHATFSVPLTAQLFKDLAATGHVLGSQLRKVQVEQDKEFYLGACKGGPWMDQKQFLKTRSNWYETHREEDPKPDPDPQKGEIVPYLTKAVVYDALPALGAAGDDLCVALGVIESEKDRKQDTLKDEYSEIFGRLVDDENDVPKTIPGINGDRMAEVLAALLRGSLLASVQGIAEGL